MEKGKYLQAAIAIYVSAAGVAKVDKALHAGHVVTWSLVSMEPVVTFSVEAVREIRPIQVDRDAVCRHEHVLSTVWQLALDVKLGPYLCKDFRKLLLLPDIDHRLHPSHAHVLKEHGVQGVPVPPEIVPGTRISVLEGGHDFFHVAHDSLKMRVAIIGRNNVGQNGDPKRAQIVGDVLGVFAQDLGPDKPALGQNIAARLLFHCSRQKRGFFDCIFLFEITAANADIIIVSQLSLVAE